MEFDLDYALLGIVLFVIAGVGFTLLDRFIDYLWS